MTEFSCISHGSCWVVDPAETFGPSHLTAPLYGVVFPVLTLVTTLANTLIIHILLKEDEFPVVMTVNHLFSDPP